MCDEGRLEMQRRGMTGPRQTTSFGKAALNEEIFGILSTALIVPLQGSHRGRVMYSAAEDALQPGTYKGANINQGWGEIIYALECNKYGKILCLNSSPVNLF
ncbi:hypothetical protein TNIN_114211 [Trichonephila inaurata madagascariensis]|uniref:Uncharacterized protein n=1 Tax=Trichonephila inaurata madagascariensis TaxID=2747483 RepID=A0A8X6K115_9ARAC|nr:hypothetical protein TNIN_114211 [Trichonephila inaurata madagascariensis]